MFCLFYTDALWLEVRSEKSQFWSPHSSSTSSLTTNSRVLSCATFISRCFLLSLIMWKEWEMDVLICVTLLSTRAPLLQLQLQFPTSSTQVNRTCTKSLRNWKPLFYTELATVGKDTCNLILLGRFSIPSKCFMFQARVSALPHLLHRHHHQSFLESGSWNWKLELL